MQKFQVEIETLSPVHIGNGNTLSFLDFLVYEENWSFFVYKFKLRKLFDNLPKALQENFLEVLERNDIIEIRDFLVENLDNLKKYVKKVYYLKIETTESFYTRWKEKLNLKIEDCEWDTYEKKKNNFYNKFSLFQIDEFINQKWKYYIPWSSLKWAIRTALTDKKIENTDAKDDIFKNLIVRDSEFIKNIKLWEKYRAGKWTYLEYIDNWEQKILTEIIIKDFFTKERLIESINNYTQEKILRYIDSINEFLNSLEDFDDEDEKIINKKEELENLKGFFEILKDKELKNNECILSLWFGGWFWFKTFKNIKYFNKELWDDFVINEKHPKFCTNHWHWAKNQSNYELLDFEWFDDDEIKNWLDEKNKKINPKLHNIIAWTEVKNFNDIDIQIPRTVWKLSNEFLNWFIKLTFKD